jgi:hypothetical protein
LQQKLHLQKKEPSNFDGNFLIMKSYPRVRTNYGGLTDISKSLNQMFGDSSHRSISRRSAHGFKNVFKAHYMSDNDAEQIVNGGMITATYLLNSKNEGLKNTGIFLSLGLFICYQAGK